MEDFGYDATKDEKSELRRRGRTMLLQGILPMVLKWASAYYNLTNMNDKNVVSSGTKKVQEIHGLLGHYCELYAHLVTREDSKISISNFDWRPDSLDAQDLSNLDKLEILCSNLISNVNVYHGVEKHVRKRWKNELGDMKKKNYHMKLSQGPYDKDLIKSPAMGERIKWWDDLVKTYGQVKGHWLERSDNFGLLHFFKRNKNHVFGVMNLCMTTLYKRHDSDFSDHAASAFSIGRSNTTIRRNST
jgi:hypothetical protein